MERNLSDEQIDKLAAKLVADFSADEETINSIADSPRLLWNVRASIEKEKQRRERGRFFAFLPRLLTIGGLATAGVAAVILLIANFGHEQGPVAVVRDEQPAPAVVRNEEKPEVPFIADDDDKDPVVGITKSSSPSKRVVEPRRAVAALRKKSTVSAPNRSAVTNERVPDANAVAAVETKTDFIPLTYASNTDGGQIVRVKVPSSMMVTLGVASNVEREGALVNAEVVVGDDGLARAIRFIR